MALKKEEIFRKLLHLFALLIPAAIFYLPLWSFPPCAAPALLSLLLIAIVSAEYMRSNIPQFQIFFVNVFGFMMRKEETTQITGATWIILSGLLCSIIFIRHTHIAFMALTLFIAGDAMAAVVGLSLGRIRIGRKSLEGSTACFLVCLILFYFIFPSVPHVLDEWGGRASPLMIWPTAFIVTVFELIPFRISRALTINDNLAVPVIAGGFMLMMEKLLI